MHWHSTSSTLSNTVKTTQNIDIEAEMKWNRLTQLCVILLFQAIVLTCVLTEASMLAEMETLAHSVASPEVATLLNPPSKQLPSLLEVVAQTTSNANLEAAASSESTASAHADASAQAASLLETGAQASVAVGVENPVRRKALEEAMTAVKEDISAKLREAERESKWVNEVEKIVKEYKLKVKKVKKNMRKIRKEVQTLIIKKRQIRNAKVQEMLRSRLQDAEGNLKMMKNKIKAFKVTKKKFDDKFYKTEAEIEKLKEQLDKVEREAAGPKKKMKPKKKPNTKKKANKKAAKKKSLLEQDTKQKTEAEVDAKAEEDPLAAFMKLSVEDLTI